MAQIVHLYLRPSSRTPVRAVQSALAVAGRGLEGDHAGGGSRQVTLIEKEAWQAACRDLRRELDPGSRRANVVVEGISLALTVGRRLRLGSCIVRVVGETRPCRLMDDVGPGLQQALSPPFRGGVYGQIVEGGTLSVGDHVRLLASKKSESPAG